MVIEVFAYIHLSGHPDAEIEVTRQESEEGPDTVVLNLGDSSTIFLSEVQAIEIASALGAAVLAS